MVEEKGEASGIRIGSASRAISKDFREHVRFLYQESFKVNVRRKEEGNWATMYATPAYITAAASIEAFINECLLSDFAKPATGDSPIWNLDDEEFEKLERMETFSKIILLPALVTGKKLEKNSKPYQDMRTLFKLRNALMHYKFKLDAGQIEKVVEDLANRGIAFKVPKGMASPWVDRVSTTEGIRWAHNVIVDLSKSLVDLLPAQHYKSLMMKGVEKIGQDEWKRFIPKADPVK